MKKLYNDPNNVVEEMIEGLCSTYAHLQLIPHANVIVRADCRSEEVINHIVESVIIYKSLKKVAIISGGGSGHEPSHAGNLVKLLYVI